MTDKKYQPVLWGAVVAWFLFAVFRETPFLQHEILGQAFLWIQQPQKFFNLLFDSQLMDCAPGRFRYVEYLFEAAYWKAMAAGLIPKDLYDYGAIAVALLCVRLIYQIGKKRGLRWEDIFLLATFFLLASQVHLTAVFNFRKAKFFVSLYFLVMAYLPLTNLSSQKRMAAYLCLTVIGFLTDPFFILISPIVALGIDLSSSQKKLPTLRTVGAGLVLGFVVTFLLTDAIGPHFSPASRLIFSSLGQKPTTFLEVANFPYFTNILADLFAPQLFRHAYQALGFGLFLVTYGLAVWMFRAKWKEYGLFVAFLLSLPIGAFCLLPVQSFAYFSGYYGHTFLALFILGAMDVILFLRSRGPRMVVGAQVFLLMSLVLHQIAKPVVFERWKEVYSDSGVVRDKVTRDYRELQAIRAHFRRGDPKPYDLLMDSWKVDKLFLSKGQYFDEGGRFQRTYLAYLLIPILFEKEVNEGKLRIVVTK